MNELVEWKPFREVSRLRREMDRLFEDFFGPARRALRPLEMEWAPAVDLEETSDKVTIKAEVPGIDPKDIDISLSGEILSLKGEKKTEREEKGKNFHLVERSYGSFSRSLRLPAAVNADKIEATYKDGILTITCPKKEAVKPKAIKIKAG
jgi:HSP20 family protein